MASPRNNLKVLVLFFASLTVIRGFFGGSLYAESLIGSKNIKMAICEKVGINQEEPPLYYVAFMSSSDVAD